MNPISYLIGISALIIVGVFAYSFGSMKNEVAANPEEKEQLRRELAQLEQLVAAKNAEVEMQKEDSQADAEVEALKLELETLKMEKLMAEQEALSAEVEETPIVEAAPELEISPADEERLQRRARLVSKAILMAEIEKYYPDDGFATINIINFENIQEGIVLGIRRDAGIIGKLQVSTVDVSQAIADVIRETFVSGEIDVLPGDELVLPPL